MDDWNKLWLGEEYPCNYCNGHHLDIECPIFQLCGYQYIHWNGYPKSYSFSPNHYYDSSVICDVGMGNEVENAKQEAHNVNSLMECTNLLDKFNSKITKQTFEYVEQQSKILKLLDKLDAIQLEITVQAKLEEIEAQQGESYGEIEIVSKFWLQKQTQLLKFQESISDGLIYMPTQLIEGRVQTRNRSIWLNYSWLGDSLEHND
ncbi:hypothetical protein H5410_014971 [Solanum commersonii]|uniref:Uncharacterized protein n=1 Tax=Solanum commersonii TaxID=4109 RepID=A0A9J5ZSS0_SOLCO|nr:hypothetical protein H5410_014971 [Solanum commersonii]